MGPDQVSPRRNATMAKRTDEDELFAIIRNRLEADRVMLTPFVA